MTRHVRNAEERLMLQAMLGSDAKRELLGYERLTAMRTDTTTTCDPKVISVFFELSETIA